MGALSPPRHPDVAMALGDARAWCAGRVIDERPAIVHAVRVAATLDAHLGDPPVALTVAALLHDSPEFALAGLDLDAYLTATYGAEVTRIVRELEAEHAALDQPDPPVRVDDPMVLLASTADRIVAFASLLRRATDSGDVPAFFAARPGLVALLPHFRAGHHAAQSLVPASMFDAAGALLDRLDHAAVPSARR